MRCLLVNFILLGLLSCSPSNETNDSTVQPVESNQDEAIDLGAMGMGMGMMGGQFQEIKLKEHEKVVLELDENTGQVFAYNENTFACIGSKKNDRDEWERSVSIIQDGKELHWNWVGERVASVLWSEMGDQYCIQQVDQESQSTTLTAYQTLNGDKVFEQEIPVLTRHIAWIEDDVFILADIMGFFTPEQTTDLFRYECSTETLTKFMTLQHSYLAGLFKKNGDLIAVEFTDFGEKSMMHRKGKISEIDRKTTEITLITKWENLDRQYFLMDRIRNYIAYTQLEPESQQMEIYILNLEAGDTVLFNKTRDVEPIYFDVEKNIVLYKRQITSLKEEQPNKNSWHILQSNLQ